MTPLLLSDPRATDALAGLDDEPVQARSLPTTPMTPQQVRDAAWSLDDLWLPAVVGDRDALAHNLQRFARWCTEHNVDHAPHGKTSMSPYLWSAQLEHGAWAITAATVAQARVMRRYGVPRVLLANEVLDPAQLRWVAEAADDPGFELLCLLDSTDGLRALVGAVDEAGSTSPVPVLVELGVPGRRTGVRGVEAARELATAVAADSRLRLAGIEGYEGVLATRRDDEAESEARRWLTQLTDLVATCDTDGLFAHATEVVLTAGGSGYVDLVADAFGALTSLSKPVRPVVRSGCYISHDHLSYERSSPLRSSADPDPLQPALSCFARVLSCPEPGRALLGVGKRDVAFDIDLPVVLSARRDGTTTPLGDRARIVELNDHHGFCDHDGVLEVGDVVELGLSHPCTIFDKWSLIPVIDAHRRVVDAIRTIF
jgi:D-serine deaminase-like pyridoxal phosphate-dependent protein